MSNELPSLSPSVRFASVTRAQRSAENSPSEFTIEGINVPIACRWNEGARRYSLTLTRDGRPRITIPRRGTLAEARRVAARHLVWLQRQLAKFQNTRERQAAWIDDGLLMFRGELSRIERRDDPVRHPIVFAGMEIPIPSRLADTPAVWRALVVRHLRELAAVELPARVIELARQHECDVLQITVRNQRSRWGSCSGRKSISLNWRLVQTPEFVRDYIILHELMHIRELNHSARFWAHVGKVCPDYARAEHWLKANTRLLHANEGR